MNKRLRLLIALMLCLSCFSGSVLSGDFLMIGDGVHIASDALERPPADVIKIQAEAMIQSKSTEQYLLGSGDKIRIHVFRETDLDVEVRLGASGEIRYPFLGKIHIIGMTLPDLERKITDDLSDGYLVDPQVRVSIEEFRPFYVNGEVKAPGAYPFQPGLTVLKAISLAGGFSINADKRKIFLIRASDIENEEEKALLNQQMDPGDILTIKKSFFFVNGEVKQPGKYAYQTDLTVRKAISLAGGFSVDADKNKIFLINAADIRDVEIKVQLSDRIAPEDILTIKQSFFFVNGEVKQPGKYSYQTDMTYRMAIAMAGGLKEKSDANKVYVIHKGQAEQVLHVNNLEEKIAPGDVITAEESFF